MAEALGAKFYDGAGNQLKPIGQNLKSIQRLTFGIYIRE
jgi:glycerate kinase